MKRLVNGWMTIPAFRVLLDGPQMVKQMQPSLWRKDDGQLVISLQGPIEYEVNSLLNLFDETHAEDLTIDVGGRTFGVPGPVLARCETIRASINEMMSLAKSVIHAGDPT